MFISGWKWHNCIEISTRADSDMVSMIVLHDGSTNESVFQLIHSSRGTVEFCKAGHNTAAKRVRALMSHRDALDLFVLHVSALDMAWFLGGTLTVNKHGMHFTRKYNF